MYTVKELEQIADLVSKGYLDKAGNGQKISRSFPMKEKKN